MYSHRYSNRNVLPYLMHVLSKYVRRAAVPLTEGQDASYKNELELTQYYVPQSMITVIAWGNTRLPTPTPQLCTIMYFSSSDVTSTKRGNTPNQVYWHCLLLFPPIVSPDNHPHYKHASTPKHQQTFTQLLLYHIAAWSRAKAAAGKWLKWSSYLMPKGAVVHYRLDGSICQDSSQRCMTLSRQVRRAADCVASPP